MFRQVSDIGGLCLGFCSRRCSVTRLAFIMYISCVLTLWIDTILRLRDHYDAAK